MQKRTNVMQRSRISPIIWIKRFTCTGMYNAARSRCYSLVKIVYAHPGYIQYYFHISLLFPAHNWINSRVSNSLCQIVNLTKKGLTLFKLSFEKNRMWPISHVYFNYEKKMGNYDVDGYKFEWSDGVFSVTLGKRSVNGYRKAYFHALSR